MGVELSMLTYKIEVPNFRMECHHLYALYFICAIYNMHSIYYL